MSRGLNADQFHGWFLNKVEEPSHRVTSATDTRDYVRRELSISLEALFLDLCANHRLEASHHIREGVRSYNRADDVVRIVRIRDPITHRLVCGVLERLASTCYASNLSAKESHTPYVQRLAFDVDFAHIHNARHPHERAHGRCRNTVLPSAGLRDNALPAESLCQQDLAYRVVYLVRSGVQKEAPTPEEEALKQAATQRLQPARGGGFGTPGALNAFLVAMLFFEPGSMRVDGAETKLPAWLLTPYQQVFAEAIPAAS